MKYKFSKSQVEDAALVAESKTEMMRLLGIKQGGGGYQALDKWCKRYEVVPPDGSGIGRKNIQKHSWVAMSDDEWFVNGVFRTGQHTRKRLVSRGIVDKCSICGQLPEWQGKPLTLQVDHINGDRWDNRIENVRILCPHCHTQTETYASTGSRRARKYCICGAEISKESDECSKCSTAY